MQGSPWKGKQNRFQGWTGVWGGLVWELEESGGWNDGEKYWEKSLELGGIEEMARWKLSAEEIHGIYKSNLRKDSIDGKPRAWTGHILLPDKTSNGGTGTPTQPQNL